MLLENKVILIVGAGGLLGREIVRSVVREGARVIAADIKQHLVDPLAQELGQDQVLPLEIDITDKDAVGEVFTIAEQKWKRIDGAVNTAYPRNENYGRKALDVTYEDFCENVGLHLGGYFLFMQQCACYAKESGEPFSLVNLSSIYGVIAPRFDIYNKTDMTMPVEYAAIKSALLHLNSYFTAFMKGTEFRVNAVSPGGLLDKQDEIFVSAYNSYCRSKGMLDKSSIVGAVSFLLSDLSQFICSQNLIVDDAFTV
ncbi:oxidoreductase [Marinobacter sp. V034]|uniref:oxidoreductase n=1 Tax=Marinobacter sp. V034 TaxID=3459610 RepID=UPI0040439C6E